MSAHIKLTLEVGVVDEDIDVERCRRSGDSAWVRSLWDQVNEAVMAPASSRPFSRSVMGPDGEIAGEVHVSPVCAICAAATETSGWSEGTIELPSVAGRDGLLDDWEKVFACRECYEQGSWDDEDELS